MRFHGNVAEEHLQPPGGLTPGACICSMRSRVDVSDHPICKFGVNYSEFTDNIPLEPQTGFSADPSRVLFPNRSRFFLENHHLNEPRVWTVTLEDRPSALSQRDFNGLQNQT